MVKESTCQCRRHMRHGFDYWVGKIPWRRKWQPTPVFLPGKSLGQRRLVATVHGVTKELGRTEQLTLSVSLHVYYLHLFSDPLKA